MASEGVGDGGGGREWGEREMYTGLRVRLTITLEEDYCGTGGGGREEGEEVGMIMMAGMGPYLDVCVRADDANVSLSRSLACSVGRSRARALCVCV